MAKRIVACAVLLATGIGISLFLRVRFGSPELACDVARYSFGEITPGKTFTETFRISNVGNRTVTVDDAISSCSCADVQIKPGRLTPGMSTELVVRFRLSSESNWSRARVVVSTTEPKDAFEVLRVVGRTPKSLFQVSPSVIDYGELQLSKVTEATVSLRMLGPVSDSLQARYRSAICRNDIQVNVTEDAGAWWLRASLSESTASGPLDGVVLLDSPQQTDSIEIPVLGYVQGPIHATPTHTFLGLLSNDHNASVTIELTMEERGIADGLSVIAIDGNIQGVVTCKINPAPDRLSLTISADYRKAVASNCTSFEGAVRLQSSESDTRLNIPVTFFVKANSDG